MKSFTKLLAGLRIEHLWALTVMVGIFAFVNTHPIRPHDFWWHLAIGRDTVETGHIQTQDLYSYTRPGEPYLSYYQFWLMDVALYLIYRAGGAILTILVQSLLVSSAYFLLLWIGWRTTGNWRAAALGTFFAAAMGFGNWNVRPQIISYLLGALVLWGVIELRQTRNPRWLALFPPVLALWVNSHGSFPIGLALIGCWLAEEIWLALARRLRTGGADGRTALRSCGLAAAALLLALLGCLANPRGLGFVDYLSQMAGNTVVQNFILEWMPPSFNSLEGSIFLLGLLLSAVLLGVSPRRLNLFQAAGFLLFGVLGLKYIRGAIWFGIFMAPVVADQLAGLLDDVGVRSASGEVTPQARRINLAFVAALALLGVLSLPWFKEALPLSAQKRGLVSVETPLQATAYMLAEGLPGEVFHDMAFGSYLEWAAQPAYKVFVDSRVELYPMEIWDDYWCISNVTCDWEALTRQYGINTLMLEPAKQAPLIAAASQSSNWVLAYQDAQAVVYTRR